MKETMLELDKLAKLEKELYAFEKEGNVEDIRPVILKFLSARPLLGISRSSAQIWHRARKCENDVRFENVENLIYPPASKTTYNRANLPGVETLYAAWNEATALDEIHIETGDLVQVSALRPIALSQIPCHVVGEYQLFNASGRSMVGSEILMQQLSKEMSTNYPSYLVSLFVDSVCATFFRKFVPRNEPERYKLTALIAELLLGCGGLIYPSVRNAGAMNIAISGKLFDSQFEMIGTRVYRVIRNLGYGLYDLEITGQSCDFSLDGSINWNSSKARQMSWNPQVGWREIGEIEPGWRKNGGIS